MGTQIKTYVCRTKCFHRNRLWKVGEIFEPMPGEMVPKHFVEKSAYKPEPVKPVPQDARTFSEHQQQEAQAVLNGTGQPGQPTPTPLQSAVGAAPPAQPGPEGQEPPSAAEPQKPTAEGQQAVEAPDPFK